MIDEKPIDDLSSVPPNIQSDDAVVKVIAGALFLIVLLFGFLCFTNLVEAIYRYFVIRHKYAAGFEIHSIVLAISLSGIPLMNYYNWRKRFRTKGFVPYLILLCVAGILFTTIFLLGVELLFALPKYGMNANPLLPSYAVFVPFPLYFDLLLILSGLLSFLILRIILRKKTD